MELQNGFLLINWNFMKTTNVCSGNACIIYYVGNYFPAMSSIAIVQNLEHI